MISLGLNALIGALIALAIAALARSGVAFIAGLLPLFPTFSLFAHIKAFEVGGSCYVKEVSAFGLVSLVPYAGYLMALIVLVDRLELKSAMMLSLGVWLVLAGCAIAVWSQFLTPRPISLF